MFEMKEGLFDIVNRPSFMVGIGRCCLFFSYCLNIWNTVVTGLMSLSTNSITCVITGSVLIDFSPYYGSYFHVSFHV